MTATDTPARRLTPPLRVALQNLDVVLAGEHGAVTGYMRERLEIVRYRILVALGEAELPEGKV